MSKFNYKDPQALNSVAEFHQEFRHIVADSPAFPPEQIQSLRYNLIKEELEEFREACLRGDMVGVADALADLQYVLTGTILSFGLADKFKAIFYEVQRSNMSKACLSEVEALKTIQLQPQDKEYTHYQTVGGKWIVERLEDRKTIKSVNYSPARIRPLVERTEIKPGQLWTRRSTDGTLQEIIWIKDNTLPIVNYPEDAVIGEVLYVTEDGYQTDGWEHLIHEHYTYLHDVSILQDAQEIVRVSRLLSRVRQYTPFAD